MKGARANGATLVEVVVALAILSLNVVGWSALVRLVVLLLQRSAALLVSVDGPDLVGMCSLGSIVIALPPRGTRWRFEGETGYTGAPRPDQPRGLTLVEVLVALALASLLFGLLASGFASISRFSRVALATGDALSVRLAVPTMLQGAVEVAGRGVSDGCGLALDVTGRRLAIRFRSVGQIVVYEVFAALDGGGRPALYLRRVPHARQPWLADVTSFHVVGHELDSDGRVAALSLALGHLALDELLEVRVTLPHRPCLEVAP